MGIEIFIAVEVGLLLSGRTTPELRALAARSGVLPQLILDAEARSAGVRCVVVSGVH
ncbi:hypothetical protein [Streptomyces violascens]|uniref:hypothetical protein n=1 Tax=Streptomyces violascens TaxID=67381 RepID=UPI00364BB911